MNRTRRTKRTHPRHRAAVEHRVDNLLDLASLVHRKFLLRGRSSPGVAVVRRLLQVVYLTTLKTEEAESLRCTVAYIDPACPDPEPPRRHVADRWRCSSLGERIPCDPRNLAKLSKGADPASTVLAVHIDSAGELFIWDLWTKWPFMRSVF
jgi:hypothetical protein